MGITLAELTVTNLRELPSSDLAEHYYNCRIFMNKAWSSQLSEELKPKIPEYVIELDIAEWEIKRRELEGETFE